MVQSNQFTVSRLSFKIDLKPDRNVTNGLRYWAASLYLSLARN